MKTKIVSIDEFRIEADSPPYARNIHIYAKNEHGAWYPLTGVQTAILAASSEVEEHFSLALTVVPDLYNGPGLTKKRRTK